MNSYVTYAQHLLQLVLAPNRGWEDISVSEIDIDGAARKLMFPLFFFAGLSVFIQLIYHSSRSMADIVISAAVMMVSYFATYFYALARFRMGVWKYVDGEPSERKSHILIVYILSLLALCSIICNLLPMTLGLPYLFPLGVTLVAWKANNYLKVRADKDLNFALFVLFSLTLPPILIQSIFVWILGLNL